MVFMNERIKELLTQAGFTFDENGDLNTLAAKRVEKFAELIILECADVASDDWQTAGRAIKDHFGVEE
jgi:hypothetical protein